MNPKIPLLLKQYFWEINFNTLNPDEHPRYIIERLLEYGDERALSWLLKKYPPEKIKAAVVKSRQLSLKSANFWALYFGLNKEEVLCLNKQFRKTQRAIWKY